MKSNAQIAEMIRKNQFDSVRYASIERLKSNLIDAQSWLFLGQAMVGLKRGKMAKLCFQRSILLDPFATWVNQAWTAAKNAGEGRDDKQVFKLLETQKVTVSACIIARNNDSIIKRCIDSIKGAVDEIVLVDTGSTDGTVQIVESLCIKVHHFQWIDDFAAARNYAQSLATSDWVITVDTDDVLYPEDKDVIRKVASCYDLSEARTVIAPTLYQIKGGNLGLPVFMGRMFRKSAGIHWRGRIHEECGTDDGYQLRVAAIRFTHDGYDASGGRVNLERAERNIRLLRQCITESPENHTYQYYLGRELFAVEQYDDAMLHLKRSLELNTQSRTAMSLLTHLLDEMGCHEEAILNASLLIEMAPQFPDGWGWTAYLTRSEDHAKRYVQLVKHENKIMEISEHLYIYLQRKFPHLF